MLIRGKYRSLQYETVLTTFLDVPENDTYFIERKSKIFIYEVSSRRNKMELYLFTLFMLTLIQKQGNTEQLQITLYELGKEKRFGLQKKGELLCLSEK